MTEKEQKKTVLDFLKKNRLAVLSTINKDNKPESAVIQFSETNNLEIIFDTFSSYRKYKNLKDNKYVSLAIGWDDDITVQYQGFAKELEGREVVEAKQTHLKKLPKADKFAEMEETRYFVVRPTWIRYSNLAQEAWDIFEIDFWV